MHCLWEIIDNAVDEALGGHCDHVEVTLHRDGSVEVRDNGRGVPVDIEPRTGLTGVELVYTRLHAGGKFGGGSYTASGGLHGVGASVVNALSSRLDVEVDRGGKTYAMSFRRGEPGVFSDVAGAKGAKDPEHKFTPYVEHQRARGHRHDPPRGHRHPGALLGRPADLPARRRPSTSTGLVARARQTSFLVPGLTIVIRDLRGEEPTEEVFLHDGGISEFCEFLAPDPPVTDVWRLQGTGTFKETVPVLDAKGHMSPTEVERECAVDVAVRWGTGYDTRVTLVRQHHRHPQGRHPPGRLRPGAAQGAAHASSSSTRAGSRSAATSSRRTTPWRA